MDLSISKGIISMGNAKGVTPQGAQLIIKGLVRDY